MWYNRLINTNDSVKLDGCRLDSGAVPDGSTKYTPIRVYVYGAETGSTDT